MCCLSGFTSLFSTKPKLESEVFRPLVRHMPENGDRFHTKALQQTQVSPDLPCFRRTKLSRYCNFDRLDIVVLVCVISRDFSGCVEDLLSVLSWNLKSSLGTKKPACVILYVPLLSHFPFSAFWGNHVLPLRKGTTAKEMNPKERCQAAAVNIHLWKTVPSNGQAKVTNLVQVIAPICRVRAF